MFFNDSSSFRPGFNGMMKEANGLVQWLGYRPICVTAQGDKRPSGLW